MQKSLGVRESLWTTAGAVCGAVALSLVPLRSDAVCFTVEGNEPTHGDAFRFTADLSIAVDGTVTLVLTNDSMNLSPASPSFHPDDLLTSFYFDIFDGSSRPTLVYTGATGDVCLTDMDAPDDCAVTTNESDLRATALRHNNTWQFRDFLTLQPGTETLFFGVGTAGNNSLNPNGFNGSIVDGMDYGIYAGDVSTTNLDDRRLVTGSITFTWTGASGFNDTHIGSEVLFGLGTAPDSTAFVPEPATGALLGLGLVGLAWSGRRRS